MAQVRPSEVSYGSDTHGLVWGYRFAPEQAPVPIGCEAAVQWLNAPTADPSEFIWLHLSLSNTAAERWMHESLELSASFFESLRENTGSTRLELGQSPMEQLGFFLRRLPASEKGFAV